MLNLRERLDSAYRGRRYESLIRYINAFHPQFAFSNHGGKPRVVFDGKTFASLHDADDRIYPSIRAHLPADMTREFYRIALDLVTRYIFPHMMPCLRPVRQGIATMS